MFELAQDAMLTRNGSSIRADSRVVQLLIMLVLFAVRDRIRIHIVRTGDQATLHQDVDGELHEMVPPPPSCVDAWYTLLAVDPVPWYRRLAPRRRREPHHEFRSAWQGRIEVRLRGLVLPVECDVLPHPDGLFITLEPATTAAERDAFRLLLAQTEQSASTL